MTAEERTWVAQKPVAGFGAAGTAWASAIVAHPVAQALIHWSPA